jgi:hypothetical protein
MTSFDASRSVASGCIGYQLSDLGIHLLLPLLHLPLCWTQLESHRTINKMPLRRIELFNFKSYRGAQVSLLSNFPLPSSIH